MPINIMASGNVWTLKEIETSLSTWLIIKIIVGWTYEYSKFLI
jgi:hypothetical protein